MTVQEKELLTRFLQQLASAQAGHKDREAEALIREAVDRQPDAAYLLVQRALQLEQLLEASQRELKELKGERDRAPQESSRGFLSDPNAWGSRPGSGRDQQHTGRNMAPGNARGAAPAGSWSSGLFGNIASTAAGVVAGSFLFQGIQGLLNRGESNTESADQLAATDQAQQSTSAEPELLNSFETPESGADSNFLSDVGDGGDFA